ncbi:MAG: hypothetical protein L6U99_06155 [Clostridium sp.]|nr:MAG: hypothetical protein L6U99_06155 [Clostridium sp.]
MYQVVFPTLFINSNLCSSNECEYLFKVIEEFLCPSISDNVLTSIPSSNALVANVCLKE